MDVPADQSQKARIRSVEAAHIGDLIRIGEETNLSPWTAQSYLEELKNVAAIMRRLVAHDNSTIGFIVGRIVVGWDVDTQLDAEIYNIAVAGTQQRTGCGQILFDAFVDACKEREVRNLWLEVRESNEKARRFYEKNGFESVQTRPSFYDNPREHAILMKLVLK